MSSSLFLYPRILSASASAISCSPFRDRPRHTFTRKAKSSPIASVYSMMIIPASSPPSCFCFLDVSVYLQRKKANDETSRHVSQSVGLRSPPNCFASSHPPTYANKTTRAFFLMYPASPQSTLPYPTVAILASTFSASAQKLTCIEACSTVPPSGSARRSLARSFAWGRDPAKHNAMRHCRTVVT
ncbi:hypothetical protein HDK77DRAFT_269272 [Phyllosticta capitalensis]